MAQNNHQKIKLLKLMEILQRDTDEEHPLKTSELCERLRAMSITCDLRTLGRDVKLLNQKGYEIMHQMIGHERAYYLADRSFSLPELKIMLDAVQAASFVTEKKTTELVHKIAALGGSNCAELLKSHIVRFNTRKHSNETIYYAVGYLEEAIQQNRKVMFRYFDLDENGQHVFRKDGTAYNVEPVALVFNEDNYYLITYNAKYACTTSYRVDRMDSVEILDEPISEIAETKRIEVAQFTQAAFKMFDGQTQTVTLRFTDKLIGAVYDKFGEDTKMTRIDEHTIEATVQVRVAPTFWGWLFQFGTEMEIVSPDNVREEYSQKMNMQYAWRDKDKEA